MTMFIKIENGAPVGYAVVEENLKALYPGQLPSIYTPENIAPFGFGIYEFSQIPTPPKYFKLIEGTPILGENGIYYQNWQFAPMNDSEKVEADNQQATMVRQERYLRMSQCDYTQMPDYPISAEKKAEWQVYRQQLRDISLQAGFPWEVSWPVTPA